MSINNATITRTRINETTTDASHTSYTLHTLHTHTHPQAYTQVSGKSISWVERQQSSGPIRNAESTRSAPCWRRKRLSKLRTAAADEQQWNPALINKCQPNDVNNMATTKTTCALFVFLRRNSGTYAARRPEHGKRAQSKYRKKSEKKQTAADCRVANIGCTYCCYQSVKRRWHGCWADRAAWTKWLTYACAHVLNWVCANGGAKEYQMVALIACEATEGQTRANAEKTLKQRKQEDIYRSG